MPGEIPNRLLVLWTSGDKETAVNMVLMYTINARRRKCGDRAC